MFDKHIWPGDIFLININFTINIFNLKKVDYDATKSNTKLTFYILNFFLICKELLLFYYVVNFTTKGTHFLSDSDACKTFINDYIYRRVYCKVRNFLGRIIKHACNVEDQRPRIHSVENGAREQIKH